MRGPWSPSIHEFCKKFGEVIDGLPNVEGHIVTYLKGAVAGLPEVEAPFVRPRKFQLFREESPKNGSLRCAFFHMAATFFFCALEEHAQYEDPQDYEWQRGKSCCYIGRISFCPC